MDLDGYGYANDSTLKPLELFRRALTSRRFRAQLTTIRRPGYCHSREPWEGALEP